MTNWKDEQPATKSKPPKEKNEKGEKGKKKSESDWKKVKTYQKCVSSLKRSGSISHERHKSPPGPLHRRNSTADHSNKTLRDKGTTITIKARKEGLPAVAQDTEAEKREEKEDEDQRREIEEDHGEDKPVENKESRQPTTQRPKIALTNLIKQVRA